MRGVGGVDAGHGEGADRVDQPVDAAEALQRLLDQRSAGGRIAKVDSGYAQMRSGSARPAMIRSSALCVRSIATSRAPQAARSSTTAAPRLPPAPVTMTTWSRPSRLPAHLAQGKSDGTSRP